MSALVALLVEGGTGAGLGYLAARLLVDALRPTGRTDP